MSTVRYLNDVPHIVRYGSTHSKTDDGHDASWMLFWRNAKYFEVSVNDTDVAGTRFEQQWIQSLAANHDATRTMKYDSFVKCWDDLCDSVFVPIQSTLESLAPTGERYWVTLEDYISTPGYRLSIHKSAADSDEDITVRIDEGPVTMSAYSLHPLPLSMFPDSLPPSLPQITASDLTVLDQAKSLRADPSKVRLPDGTTAFLIGAEQEIRRMPEDIVSHPFMETATIFLQLHELFADPATATRDLACLLKPLGIVTTTTAMPASSHMFAVADMYVAGLLLPHVSRAASLGEPSSISLLVSLPGIDDVRKSMHQELLRAMTVLHGRDPPIVHGNINPWTILVRREGSKQAEGVGLHGPPSSSNSQNVQAFLVNFSPGMANGLFIDPELTGTVQADVEGLENVFGDEGWLVHEIKKARGDLATEEQWHRRVVSPPTSDV